MQTLQAWLKNQYQIAASNRNSVSKNDLQLLLEHLLQQNSAWIFSHPEHQLNTHQTDQLDQWVEALKSGQPLAYITGQQMFWDLILKVNPHTLIPRPDTETLIETVIELLAQNPPKHILDLGTGSGALALVLAKHFSNANVLAVDQSAQALRVAEHNANANHIVNIEFQQSNWFNNITSGPFDLIISNPPYIAADDSHLKALQHEPMEALVADNNGLGDYLRITSSAQDFLTDGGLLIFEHGWLQQKQVKEILVQAGMVKIGSRKDLAGHDRVTFAYKSY